jgi:hypothetical protein
MIRRFLLLFTVTSCSAVPTISAYTATQSLSIAGVVKTQTQPPPQPPQNLPPGAIKHPGEKCASTIQPPEYQACPATSDTQCINAQGATPYFIGECEAAERGFFNPPYNFQPRNWKEACISRRENGGGYDRSSNPSHFGRWQFATQIWHTEFGQSDWGYASPAEQDRVFVESVRDQGYAPWAGNGC